MSKQHKKSTFDSEEEQDQRRRRDRSEEDSRRSRSRSRSRDREREFEDDQDDEDHSQEDQEQGRNPQNHQNNQSSDSSGQITAQTYAVQIRSAILDFFGKIKHQKGFVFTPQEREKMRKEQQRYSKKDKSHKKIQWSEYCQWKQEDQRAKIDKLFNKESLNIPEDKVSFFKEIFLNTSYLFGKETTPQLYQIMMRILKAQLQKQLLAKVKEFMSYVLNDKTDFKFFNFKYSSYHKLPPSSEQNEQTYHQLGENIYWQIQKANNSERP